MEDMEIVLSMNLQVVAHDIVEDYKDEGESILVAAAAELVVAEIVKIHYLEVVPLEAHKDHMDWD
jgi:hypothetical protein